MANKLLTAIVVVVIVVAVIAAAVVVTGGDENGDETPNYEFEDLQLMIYGNANGDFTIDDSDRQLVQSIIDGGDQSALAEHPFADVDNNGVVDSADLELLDRIIDRQPCTVNVACVDLEGNDVVKSVSYPLNNIALIGVNVITAALYTNAGDKVVAYASFPTSYPNMYSQLGGTSFSAGLGPYYDWSIFTQVDQQTPVDAVFVDAQYAAFVSENDYASLDLGGIPYMVYQVSSPNAHTSAVATIGFLCGTSTEAVGYSFVSSTVDVLTHVSSVLESVPEDERSTFMTFATSMTTISQNDHPNNDVGILAGGIPYHEVNSEFTSLYPGSSTSTTAPDALAQFKDADAYILITSKDFGSDMYEYIISLFEPASGNDPQDFFYGVIENWHYINNLLPGAVKVACMAEILYPDLFSGYGDEVLQSFIDAGYSPFEGQSLDTIISVMDYQDYLDAKAAQGA